MNYLKRVWRLHRYEGGWRTYTRVDDGQLIQVEPRKISRHWDFLADPFLFEYNDSIWLFCETVNDVWKGRIECFKYSQEKWEPVGIVLERPWHMSYPQVFEEDGHIYMIPEQSNLGKGDVSLYEAVDFPFRWEKVKTLIDRPFADATLLRRDGYYYLACYTIPPQESAELWCASSLFGEWKRHPKWQNIHQEARWRRCGGAFLDDGGNLYRIAQDCDGGYGLRLYKIPIIRISPFDYEEGVPVLFIDERQEPKAFKHTYNKLPLKTGGCMAAIDVQCTRKLPLKNVMTVLLKKAKRKIIANNG